MFISITIEDSSVETKQLIAEHYNTLEGRKRLTESLHHEIEKAARILKRKYCYDATIAEYMDDFRQSFSLYLIEHAPLWKRALSFDSLSAFFRTELDYFIGEQSDSIKRSGYRTLARWTRDALRSDNTFSYREIRGQKQRALLIFGLTIWKKEKPLFKTLHGSFQQFRDEIRAYDIALSFNPLTQTKPEFNALVERGVYHKNIETQIQECTKTLVSLANSWCSIAELISGFRMFWLGFEKSDELISDEIAIKSAELDYLLYEDAVTEMKKFLIECQPVEISILQTLLLKQSGHKVRFQDSAQKHGITPSSVTERKRKLFERLSATLSAHDEGFKQMLLTTLIELVPTSKEDIT